jgi:DNA mismatch endonuclease (patch repair protein)
MQRQKTRDTGPELAVRKLLHAAGLRYRVDVAPLPEIRRRADVVFRSARVALFIDGCFWHGCPTHGARTTKSNPSYWSEKVLRNQARDRDTDAKLKAAGWLPVRVWEHQPPDSIAATVLELVTQRRGISLQTSAARSPSQPTQRDYGPGRA